MNAGYSTLQYLRFIGILEADPQALQPEPHPPRRVRVAMRLHGRWQLGRGGPALREPDPAEVRPGGEDKH